MKVLFIRFSVGLLAALMSLTCLGANHDHDHHSIDSSLSPEQKQLALNRVLAVRDWLQEYQAAAGGGRVALENQGASLFAQRREALAALIKNDPALALTVAFTTDEVNQLPASLAGLVETRVSGIGDLSVLIYCPGPDGQLRPMERRVMLDGATYSAFVYGRRLAQTTKHGIPLSGIVLDGMLALDESPIQEIAGGGGTLPLAAHAGQFPLLNQGVAGKVGASNYRFNSKAHFEALKAELEFAEAALGPKPIKTAAQILAGDSVFGSGSSGGTGANPPTAWTTGEKNILVIRVDFSDLPGDPVYPGIVGTAAYMEGLANGPVAEFYVRSSYGQTTITNTVTTQLYRLPQPSTTYSATFDVEALHADARALAAADYTLADYDRICVVFTFIPDFGFGGLAQLGGPNLWVNGEFDFRVYAHELGHTYGLLHAGLWQVSDGNPISPVGTVVEYGDDFDTMGANFANEQRTDFNPYFKNILGWLRDDQVQVVDATPATYRIHTFDYTNEVAAPSAPLLAIRIVKDSTKSYWVGLRHNFEDNQFLQNGAYVIWGYNQAGSGGGGGFQSALLDFVTPGTSLLDSALPIGVEFQDTAIGISFSPSDPGGSNPNRYVDVLINGGAPLIPEPRLLVNTNYISGGNGNGIIDFNECNNLAIVLTNRGTADATEVQVTVTTTTPGVTIGTRTVSLPDLPVGAGATNAIPITISTAPFFVCGTPINLNLQIKCSQNTSTGTIQLRTGVTGLPTQFDNSVPVFIPDDNLAGASSLITVSNITSAIDKVTVSLFLTHTWDSDLTLELIGPDGETVILSQNNGGSSDNYGASCTPNLLRTTFDDAALAPITGGSAPFVGTFRPQERLAAFVGKAGTNVNGTWTLRAVDSVGFDVGTLQCWSLFLYPATCTDGGGTCPGADLSIKMTDAPDPVFIGNTLTYTLAITNNGPSEAKNVVVNHQLPAAVVFGSASTSQGNVIHSGGVVVANIGTVPVAGTATIVVNVLPTLSGNFSSAASVTSNEPDPDSANNSTTVSTQILPPSADLAVGLHDSPDPALVGGMVAYTVSITNNGPSTASGVMVTNVMPISFVVQSAVPAQGAASINGNIVIFNFGTLTNGGRTTGVINASPTATGSFMATAAARANQADPVTANNTATATTVVGPAADLALTLSANPNTVVVSSNWTYTVTVTNNGPSAANGIIVTHNLPAGVNVVDTSTTSGSIVVSGGVATTTISSLASGGGAVIQVVVNSGSTNTYNSSATVTGAEADGNLANNSANVSTLVAAPFLSIEAVSATLTAESITPADGAVSVGETVTAEFRLRNTGNVSNTNLTATLLAVNGVTTPVPATEVNYGVLPAGGLPVGRSFSFTATGTNGGAVVATLQLRDNGSIIGNVMFNFTLPTIFTFANTNNISITDNQTTPWPAGPAAPYPSTILVSGVTGLVGKVTVTLSNLNHTYPDDIDMLLVGPGGQKIVLMSDAGGAFGLINATVTFDDAAAVIPDASQILATSYHPANYGAGDPFNSPAPGGPYGANLASFAGANPNGTWSLFIMDDATGDKGNIANGWSLAFTAITPVNQVADLIVSVGATPDPVLVGASLTTSFTISNAGPNTATGVAFTNMLPAGVSLLAASATQGSVSTNASSVVVNLGSLAAGNAAQVAVVVMPGLGVLTNSTTGFVASTASVVISDTDLNPANNTATAHALVNVPVADLVLWQTIPADQVTIGSNITFTVAVTNQGPQTALSTVVTNWLPAGLNFVSTTAATFTNASGQITVSLGDLPVGTGSSFTITATATTAGNRTNITTAVSPSSDPVVANNTASTAFTVLPLTPSIVASSARITQESGVFNGAVDLAETVTVSLSLQNVGSISTVNLRATLQAAGGVSAPSGPQSYGVLTAGGATVARPFTFTAPNTSGGMVTATLALKDERPGVTNDLGMVAFVFQLPGSTTFSNTVSIVIPEAGPASPYPSTITVSGVPGVVSRVSVTLQGLVHKFPDDVDVLLVGPAGQKVLLLSDAGGGYAVTNRTITIADGNPALPDTTEIFSGSYQPSNYESEADNFPAVAGGNPAGALSSYTGSAPNGNWSLYVVDDAAGDGGAIVGGWSLTLETISPVNPIADLQVSLSAAPDVGAPNPPFVGSALIYTLSITNLGPATASNVVVSDSLPGNLAYQSSTTTLGTLLNNSGNLTWTVGTLAAGSGATASIRTAASNGGAAVNQATAVGDETDLNPGNSTAQVSTTIRVPTLVTFSELSLTNAQLQFTLTGDAGMSYRILASTNLSTWTVLATNTAAANGTIKFVDPGVPGFGQRFYRAERLIP